MRISTTDNRLLYILYYLIYYNVVREYIKHTRVSLLVLIIYNLNFDENIYIQLLKSCEAMYNTR